jgi:hypothetical protein
MGAYHSTAKANATANVARNVWSYAIIFCGYFPDQTYTFSEAEVEDESQRAWYLRQLLPAPPTSRAVCSSRSPAATSATRSSTTSSPTCRAPATPRRRRRSRTSASATASPTTDSGPFSQQLGMVQRTILRLAFAGGEARPKPGPYRPSRPWLCDIAHRNNYCSPEMVADLQLLATCKRAI